jgi:hypothetical protein
LLFVLRGWHVIDIVGGQLFVQHLFPTPFAMNDRFKTETVVGFARQYLILMAIVTLHRNAPR